MIRDLPKLARPRVSLAVAAGALFGALYHGGGGLQAGLLAPAGAFCLCAGCSALNQVQERGLDARMERTQTRPLASGRMSPREGLAWSLSFMLSGLGLFALAGGWPLFLVGLLVAAVYNGAYTPLKRLTPGALLAGGVAGAAPPLTGWLAAGGGWADPRILWVVVIFYLWQVPHFWLLAEKHREDYRRAGFAVPHAALPPRFRARLMAVWVAAYFVALGWLAWLAGPVFLRFVVPPALLLAGGLAAGWAAADRHGPATAAMHASLPLGLATLLLNTL